MQKIIYSIILLFATVGYSKPCLNINELYDYYYINGVGSTKTSGFDSVKTLKNNLRVGKKFNLLPNPKNIGNNNELFPGFLTDRSTHTWGEIAEVFSQKKKEALSKISTEEIEDLPTIKKMYESLDETKYNIIFAHSQGNLYANSLCLYNNGKKKQINIGIAVPASKIECGSKYVTIRQDEVINKLRKWTSLDPTRNNPLPANVVLGLDNPFDELCTDLFCHSLIGVYLQKTAPLHLLQSYVKSTLDEIKDKELNFDFIKISLKEIKQEDKNVLISSYESLNEFKNNTERSVRRTVASVKTLSYLSDVANSSFMTSLIKFNFNKLSKSEFNKLLDTEIKVDSDQEYADVAGYIFDTVKGYCLKYPTFVPSNVLNYCNSSKDYYYYKDTTFQNSANFSTYSLNSKGLKWNKLDSSLTLSCLDVQEKTSFKQDVLLSYSPEYGKVVSASINEFTYNIYPRNLLNKNKEESAVANLEMKYENNEYKYNLIQNTKEINYVEIDESKQDYLRCNSINKLLSNNCKNYFLTLLSKTSM